MQRTGINSPVTSIPAGSNGGATLMPAAASSAMASAAVGARTQPSRRSGDSRAGSRYGS